MKISAATGPNLSATLRSTQAGLHGDRPSGTTGEGPSMSQKEKLEGLERILQAGIDPKKILLATGSASLPDTIESAHAALKAGCGSPRSPSLFL